jgi:hypothetical protein
LIVHNSLKYQLSQRRLQNESKERTASKESTAKAKYRLSDFKSEVGKLKSLCLWIILHNNLKYKYLVIKANFLNSEQQINKKASVTRKGTPDKVFKKSMLNSHFNAKIYKRFMNEKLALDK